MALLVWRPERSLPRVPREKWVTWLLAKLYFWHTGRVVGGSWRAKEHRSRVLADASRMVSATSECRAARAAMTHGTKNLASIPLLSHEIYVPWDGRHTWRRCTGLREGVRGTQTTRPFRYNDEEVLRNVGWEHEERKRGGR